MLHENIASIQDKHDTHQVITNNQKRHPSSNRQKQNAQRRNSWQTAKKYKLTPVVELNHKEKALPRARSARGCPKNVVAFETEVRPGHLEDTI